ncbi:DNA mismatch repair endonuclease MutL [Halovenus sp. WSH3]|uniref:DNA mismatch repair protein MutL n=1 Tax=Halovenus carboxidivorans TaxID=2692199 RepID=A0A6B0TBR1_9EURY|nr:DNA mismatch repair endonuclease MutL [Halovenus carboxidivorans]MXR52671.1 DNA mismatch repair endonuclease MutL [Halovenus carboxidivorans]
MPPSEIQELDSRTVERIAAGEVVERPASAVKELLENAIDADASRVTVAVESGGTESIRVSDDGIGMSEPALKQAIKEHTTSKIGDIEDLESGVATLGFRGEALHAIGAVSRMTITSRPRGGGRGTELVVEGGDVTSVEPAGCPEGTTVELEDLFYNVPARRKYLKQESTEFDHVNRIVTNYALANPDVAITLEHDGRETFATNGTGDLRETVLSVYGREVAESMIELAPEDVDDGPLDGISGLVSHPETNRASREYCSTFVNGRYVTANTVRDAVFEAYGAQLAPDRYPFAVVFLDVDPANVDVNVHPRKLEVRFAAEEAVSEQIESAVESALLREGLLRSNAPRGKSAPEETTVEPESVDREQVRIDRQTGESATDADRDPQDGTAESTPDQSDGSEEVAASTSGSDGAPSRAEGYPSQFDGAPSRNRAHTSGSDTPDTADADNQAFAAGQSAETDSYPPDPEGSTTSDPGSPERSSDRKFTGGAEQRRLDTDVDPTAQEFDSLPSMRVLGQLQETYIVAETADGMVLIDQHAADERINYERLRETLAGEVTTQALADPVELELTAREAELFSAHEEALATLGFRAELTDDRTVEVATVPSLVAEAADPELLRDVLGEFVSGETAAAATVEAAADELIADLACYPSITGHTSLTDGSMIDLLASLDDCENPYACPHGRPVIVEFDAEEIEARFERDYPGHTES